MFIPLKTKDWKNRAAGLLTAGFLLGAPSLAHAQFEEAINGFVEGYAIPSYDHFAKVSAAEDAALKTLCRAPSVAALTRSRDTFRDLVRAWSAVEMIRFGPARSDNRFEKIFFWPDPRARGQKQVQKLLYQLSQDRDLTLDNLQGKSVAVQGLPALEYLLFGDGAEKLATKDQAPARCLFAEKVAANVAVQASLIAVEWKALDGYRKTLTTTGPDNPIYRTDKEALQEVLKSIVEMLEINSSSKIKGSLGDDISKAQPRNAPFWRSDLTLDSLKVSLQAIMKLQAAMDFTSPLTEEDRLGGPSTSPLKALRVIKTYEKVKRKKI